MSKVKISYLVFIIFVVGCLALSQLCLAQTANSKNEDLQFLAEGGKLYFFQKRTGRIFVYQTTTGRFSHMLTLEKLGEDLKRSRSISAIKEIE